MAFGVLGPFVSRGGYERQQNQRSARRVRGAKAGRDAEGSVVD